VAVSLPVRTEDVVAAIRLMPFRRPARRVDVEAVVHPLRHMLCSSRPAHEEDALEAVVTARPLAPCSRPVLVELAVECR